MKVKTSKIILFFLLITSLLFSTQKIKEKDLPQRYRDWLNLTRYIIHETEKEVFMQLINERDRDAFIKTFWEKRDPTPGTPQNKFSNVSCTRTSVSSMAPPRKDGGQTWE